MKLPLVTVGVASFNNAAYLCETLDSIRRQTYPHVELLIVDDASHDDSVAVAEAWLAAHPEVNGRIIRHATNLGVCRVCNDIITEGRGTFTSIIGSDDTLLPDKLAQQVPLLLAASFRVGVLFGDIAHMDSVGQPLPPPSHLTLPYSGQVFIKLLEVNYVPVMSALIRRSCFDKVGLYDENLSYEDWDMWLRLAREYEFLHMPGVVARYRIHARSATFSRRAQLTEGSLQLLQKHRGHSLAADQLIAGHTRRLAETLYHLNSPQATYWLGCAWNQSPSAAILALWTLARFGIPARRISQLKRWLRGSHSATAAA